MTLGPHEYTEREFAAYVAGLTRTNEGPTIVCGNAVVPIGDLIRQAASPPDPKNETPR